MDSPDPSRMEPHYSKGFRSCMHKGGNIKFFGQALNDVVSDKMDIKKSSLLNLYVQNKLCASKNEKGSLRSRKSTLLVDERKAAPIWKVFFNEFCNNSSLHAINQVAKPIYSIYERIFWTSLFVLGVLGATYTCKKTWERYETSTTATVIETTRYSYANVPFPSVTICDKSRVDWARALALTPEDIPEPFEENKEKILILLKRVGYAGFGDFDFFDQLRLENGTDFSNMDTVNVTDILLKVMRPCEEMFFEWCWFRDLEYDCCRIFELQKTEFGFCWSFNSDTAEPSRRIRKMMREERLKRKREAERARHARMKNDMNAFLSKGWMVSGADHWIDRHGWRRPWRTAQHGPWSGLRFKVVPLPEERLPPDGNHTTSGVVVAIADPKSEPINSYLAVSPGLEVRMPVWGENLFATEGVRSLSYEARRCYFPDEDPFGLSQGFYLAANCLAACYQNYTLKYCNCSPDFIFFNRDAKGNYFKPCDAEGLLCLSKFNDIFTYEVPPIKSEFFPSTKTGINCTCPSDCTSQLYVTDLAAPSLANISTYTEIDVHFRLASCTRYRTEVVYQWLDIVVSFGGIAGLFLGASLLSAAEILYFCTVRCVFNLINSKNEAKPIQPIHPFLP